MKTFSFTEYISKGYNPTREQQAVNNAIYAFKRGNRQAVESAANMVVRAMRKWYGLDAAQFVFVCAPCSSQAKYVRRFKLFADIVAKQLGSDNAFAHILIHGDRQSLHTSQEHIVCEDNYRVLIDARWFKGKQVIIFDDIITTGKTVERFAAQLTEAGAIVRGAMSIAHTHLFKAAA